MARLALLWFSLFLQTSKEDQLWQHRNLGKAFYENPATQLQAVEELRKALDLAPDSNRERLNYGLALLRAGRTVEAIAELKRVQARDPKLPHTWFNLGIAHKRNGETDQAAATLERMVQLVPGDAVSQYNLGAVYKLQGKPAQALECFQKAAQLNPALAAPRFQLYNAFRLAGNREEAAKELAQFQALKKAQEVSGTTEDIEWNDFAELYDPIDPSPPPLEILPPRFSKRRIGPGLASPPQAIVFDFDGDGKPDVLIGGQLYRGGSVSVAVPEFQRGKSFTAGDMDNDGFPDLCMLTSGAAELLKNRKGRFEKAAQPLATGEFNKAIWIDYDHDYDLDLLLIGNGKHLLLRNQGTGGFVDRSTDFPFVTGDATDGLRFRVTPDTKANDVLIVYRDRSAVLYADRLAGKYEARDFPAVPADAHSVQARDWNHDGALDLAFSAGGKFHLLANRQGDWTEHPAPGITHGLFCDFNNLGATEVCSGATVYSVGGAARPAEGLQAIAATADFNSDGRPDAISFDANGVYLHVNGTVSRNRWFSTNLTGVKNLKLAPGAEVEVKAGRHYQKQLYEGYPLVFGLGSYAQIDTVRITWPNGLIQNETRQAPGRAATYKEAPRLSGSCPMIFTWDGHQFTFLTDVLGVAPLGASAGDGKYFPTDHDEYVSIPGAALKEREGFYDLRITEELAEVTYLDQLKLITVDHPAGTEVYSNDKWKSPPYPEFKLFQTQRRIYPVRSNKPAFPRTMLNTAGMHTVDLDFGLEAPNQGAFLVLTGWVDWADGSTFLKQSQEPGKELTPPYLQVRDAAGGWRTVIDDMGIPSGKRKTIAVDLSGKFLSASRQVRIVTNLCVYWDEIFLGESVPVQTRLQHLDASEAQLAFHGFSKTVIHPERLQPEHFLYQPAAATSLWNPTSGNYTRYGDVKPLLAREDDMFVIMGAGDEVRVRFPAAPPPPRGWKRDFLLLVDGWAKDSDANTAHSQSVEPLPFHAMRQYPYGSGEAYPRDAAHSGYRTTYNTRPALRLLRSIAP